MMRHAVAGFFLFICAGWGAPIGNPASPFLLQEGFFISDTTWCQPRAGFIEDFLGGQALTGSRHDTHIGAGKIWGLHSLGSATWSIRERFDLSFLFGSGTNKIHFRGGGRSYSGKYNGGLIWYGEAKLILFQVKDSVVSAYGEAGGWDWLKGSINGDRKSTNSDLLMRFWSAGMTLTQQCGVFSPYAGVVVMRSRWKISHTHMGEFLLHQKYPVGAVVGCSLSNASKFLLNAEWRGWTENALTASAEVRF